MDLLLVFYHTALKLLILSVAAAGEEAKSHKSPHGVADRITRYYDMLSDRQEMAFYPVCPAPIHRVSRPPIGITQYLGHLVYDRLPISVGLMQERTYSSRPK